MRSGSATRSITTTSPRVIVKPNTARGCPPGAHAAPAAPFTSAGRANRARPAKVSATAAAPRTSLEAPISTAACPAGELPGGGRGSLQDGGDLVEGHGEQVVQHERQQFVAENGHILGSQSVIILDETDPIGVTAEGRQPWLCR
jgi:hypothetical protein